MRTKDVKSEAVARGSIGAIQRAGSNKSRMENVLSLFAASVFHKWNRICDARKFRVESGSLKESKFGIWTIT